MKVAKVECELLRFHPSVAGLEPCSMEVVPETGVWTERFVIQPVCMVEVRSWDKLEVVVW